jgi:lycopene cyclase domain-containing protein
LFGKLTYLFLIMIWAGPVIVLQWLVGVDILLKRWKVLLPGIFIPTLYLTVMDAVALSGGTWTINPEQSLGWFIPFIHVPIEEAIFFWLTNILIVQSIILLWMPETRLRIRSLFRHLRRGPNMKLTE